MSPAKCLTGERSRNSRGKEGSICSSEVITLSQWNRQSWTMIVVDALKKFVRELNDVVVSINIIQEIYSTQNVGVDEFKI